MPEFSKSVYFTRFYVIFLTNLGFELVTRKKELYNQKNGKKKIKVFYGNFYIFNITSHKRVNYKMTRNFTNFFKDRQINFVKTRFSKRKLPN